MSDKGRGVRGLTLFLAAAAGFSNANIYYNQPLLGHMAHSYGEGDNSVSFIPAATQLGFALGLVLLVPLGDTLDRRKLILWQTAGLVLALVAEALAPSPLLLMTASVVVGGRIPNCGGPLSLRGLCSPVFPLFGLRYPCYP
ncbi:hypothetical protein YDYSG_51810 [Paenibacillus tyrfis]|uniref:hypothetical protein n=1 Tax=Paenibacillus tyrfis TaxID=1501230 RepID=UPI002491C43B|nr:hypothetical protein [Paenibacillus tyrfis]GLI09149.1 hypothetical protein YDYSG_51810 [Paenibacillus tyrfis]